MNRLKELRMERKWTQGQLAKKMGVTRTAVVKWESGKAYPTAEKLIELARIFKCQVDYLLCDKV
ncbi:helix-turn-helix transcriptional regulator [Megasphaera elsdenii]|uniref:helix-turn-helix transcriptional regulator n=1 Tax=Megasphaera elsdenii TaxID=907 RepID=UPI002431F34E|nr:helix-turn-helix transcriptional regulator [Megasphaera elsdenii]